MRLINLFFLLVPSSLGVRLHHIVNITVFPHSGMLLNIYLYIYLRYHSQVEGPCLPNHTFDFIYPIIVSVRLSIYIQRTCICSCYSHVYFTTLRSILLFVFPIYLFHNDLNFHTDKHNTQNLTS